MAAATLVPFIAAPLIAFGIYRRVRGSFGRQPIRRKRMIARISIFVLIALLLCSSGLQDIRLFEGAAAGLLAGAALGYVGLRLTRFEDTPEGERYVPNPWIGGVLMVLLLGRLAWRAPLLMAAMGMGGAAAVPASGPPVGNSPLTLLVVGLMMGYYIAYLAGVLVHHRRWQAARDAAVAVAGPSPAVIDPR